MVPTKSGESGEIVCFSQKVRGVRETICFSKKVRGVRGNSIFSERKVSGISLLSDLVNLTQNCQELIFYGM